MARAVERVTAIATYCLQNGNKNYGVTESDVVEALNIPKATVNRLLKSPGFFECKGAFFPKRYYFDPSSVTLPLQEVKEEGDRKYQQKILEMHISKTVPIMQNTAESLKLPVDEAMSMLVEVANNVTLFKNGEAKLDPELLIKLREAVGKAQFALESYYQFLEKFNVDSVDPTWWEVFNANE